MSSGGGAVTELDTGYGCLVEVSGPVRAICVMFCLVTCMLFFMGVTETASHTLLDPASCCPIVGVAGLLGRDGPGIFRLLKGGKRIGIRKERPGRKEPDQGETNLVDEGSPPSKPDTMPLAGESPDTSFKPNDSASPAPKDERAFLERIEGIPDVLKVYDACFSGSEGGDRAREVDGESNLRGQGSWTAGEHGEEADLKHQMEGARCESVDDPDTVPEEYSRTETAEVPQESLSDDELRKLLGLDEDEGGYWEEIATSTAPGDMDPAPEGCVTVESDWYTDFPVEVLIDGLCGDDVNIRSQAVRSLCDRGEQVVGPLISALITQDDGKRWCIAEALSAIGKGAIPPLITALKDSETQVGAATTLVRIGEPAVLPLIEALADDDSDTHLGVAYALREIGQIAIPHLVRALRSSDRMVRTRVAEILSDLRWKPNDDTERLYHLIALEEWIEVAEFGSNAIEPLIDTLQSANTQTQWHAARTLGEIGAPAVGPLVDLLRDEDPQVRSLAEMALGGIGAPAVDPLIQSLHDPCLRDGAAAALVRIGDPAVEACVSSLNDSSADSGEVRCEILVAIGEPAVAPLLHEMMRCRSPSRGWVADILDCMGWEPWSDEEKVWYLIAREQWMELVTIGRPAVEPLIRILSGGEGPIRGEAAEALGEIGDSRAVEPLVEALADDAVAAGAADALVAIGMPSVGPVIRLLKGGKSVARENAVEVLGRVGSADAVPVLAPLVRSHDDRLRRMVLEALISIGEPSIDTLIRLLDEDDPCHAGAVTALTRIGDAALEPLIRALRDEKARVRIGAAEVLKRMEWMPTGIEDRIHYLIALHQWPEIVCIGVPAINLLIPRLGDADTDVREGAAEALVRIGAPAVLPLIGAFDSTELQTPVQDVLTRIGDPAVAPLIQVMRRDFLLPAVVEVLERIGEPAVEPLIAALDDDETWPVVADILTAIGPPSIRPLIEALGSETIGTRERAVGALLAIGEPAVDSLIETSGNANDRIRLGAIDTLTRAAAIAIPSLEEALGHEDYRIRLGAAESLGRIGWTPGNEEMRARYLIAKEQWSRAAEIGQNAVGPLIQALGDPDSAIQMGAARALGMIGAPAVEALIHELRTDQGIEQRRTIEALNEIGDPAVAALIDALKNDDWHVRLGAARALVSIGDPAMDRLIRALRSSSSPAVQMGAAAALGKIGNPCAVDPLVDALLCEDWRIGRVIVHALGRMGEPAIKPLLRVLQEGNEPARKGCVTALVMIGEPAREVLPQALGHDHYRVRAGVADVLDRLAWAPASKEELARYLIAKERWLDLVRMGPSAVAPLIEVLSDRDESIRRRATEMVGELRDGRAVQPLMHLLHDDYYSIRREAAAALVKIGYQATEAVIPALEDSDDDVRRRAADVLGEIGDGTALHALAGALHDENWHVRRAARDAEEMIRKRLGQSR
jgi:HEAT repeat protein